MAHEVIGVGGEQLRERSDLLKYVILRDYVIDRWRWNLHSSKHYTVNIAHNFLQQLAT